MEDDSKVTALLDMGIEINVIIKELIEDINLAIRRGLKLELISYMGHNLPFLRLCEDIEIAIREVKIRYLIFVIEAGDYDLVLNQLFLNSVKFSQKYKLNEIFGTITYLHIH